jgi:alanine-glyoxylate transaminase / serine-glyoxylate transaminase / serine-pyruvate transaminase
MAVARGRQFFQNPGPTNIPDRILRAMDRPALDFMGGEFRAIAEECYAGLRRIFKTDGAIIAYAGNGHGAWEAAIVNVFSPGDKVLVPETGYFSLNWGKHAAELGLEVETLPSDWRKGVDPAAVEARLREDKAHTIKAVMQVHNETATGVANRIAEIRKAIDAARHPALYMVDTISSLGSIDFRMDEWQVDIAVGGSQKGLMLPPGMAFTAASEKALKASERAKLPRVYWDWRKLVTGNRQTSFNGTAPVQLFYGLQEAVRMLAEEGLDQVFARHARLAEATRRAVRAWRGNNGPELYSSDPRTHSNSVSTVLMQEGYDAEKPRGIASTSRSAAGSTGSTSAPSASAIWAISTSRCCSALSPRSRCRCSSPACRTARAASPRRWSIWRPRARKEKQR